MFLGLLLEAATAAPSGVPALPEARDLLYVDGTTLEGDGFGGGMVVRAGAPLHAPATLEDVVVVGLTAHPVRLAVSFPADTEAGLAAPRLDARFVLADRRRGILGIAAGLDI